MPTVEGLQRQGHDVLWARTDCPGLKDRDLLDRAEAEGRLVLTLDKDFWQLALMRPNGLKRCGVILFRLHPAIPEKLQPLVDSMLRVEAGVDGARQHHNRVRDRDGSDSLSPQ